MSDALPYADILILALITGFVLLRLRSVLGQNMGNENPPGYSPQDAEDTPVVQVSERQIQEKNEEKKEDEKIVAEIAADEVRSGVLAIKEKDPQFTLKNFLEGARAAFEMVFDAFNKDDREALTMLLSTEMKELFFKELDKVKNDDAHTETTLLAVDSEEVIRASLYRDTARVTVRFVSEQVTVERDKEGAIVKGDPTVSEFVEDEWTFEREINSRNPNWKIVDT